MVDAQQEDGDTFRVQLASRNVGIRRMEKAINGGPIRILRFMLHETPGLAWGKTYNSERLQWVNCSHF